MPTAREMIQTTLTRYLLTGFQEKRTRLTTSVDADDTTWTCDFPGLADGHRLSCELEDVHTWTAGTDAKSAVVERGQYGSTAASHSAGAIVYIRPHFSWNDVLGAMNDELRSLSSPANGLFRIRTVTSLVYNPSQQGYDLTGVSDILDVHAIHADTPDSTQAWPEVRSWRFRRNAAVGDFPSGYSITMLEDPPYPGQPMRVEYKAPFGTLSALTDDLTTATGLRAEAQDIVEMGAALRLLAGRPIKRSFTENQGDSRRADEVSTSDVGLAPARLAQVYRQRINEEASRLQQEYPHRG